MLSRCLTHRMAGWRRTVSELRAALLEADDLLAGLLRVAEATRTVLGVDWGRADSGA
jgi:hypothetical protein